MCQISNLILGMLINDCLHFMARPDYKALILYFILHYSFLFHFLSNLHYWRCSDQLWCVGKIPREANPGRKATLQPMCCDDCVVFAL